MESVDDSETTTVDSANSTAQATTAVFTTIVEVRGPGGRGRDHSALCSSAFVGRPTMWNSARPQMTVRSCWSQLASTQPGRDEQGAANTQSVAIPGSHPEACEEPRTRSPSPVIMGGGRKPICQQRFKSAADTVTRRRKRKGAESIEAACPMWIGSLRKDGRRAHRSRSPGSGSEGAPRLLNYPHAFEFDVQQYQRSMSLVSHIITNLRPDPANVATGACCRIR